MALDILTPFNYNKFCRVNGDFIRGLVFNYKEGEPGYWTSLLNRYQFGEMGFEEGKSKRLEFHRLLKNAEGHELVDVFNSIMDWGNMKYIKDEMTNNLRNSLTILDRLTNGAIKDFKDVEGICVARLASVTKIYEMWDLDNWIIYDSYCVKGLQWFISNFWQFPQHEMNKRYLRLPWPPGRVGQPIEGFPQTAETAPREKRLGFIYGSWLCKYMANVLNAIYPNNMHWRTFHVEMLAFQKGHEI